MSAAAETTTPAARTRRRLPALTTPVLLVALVAAVGLVSAGSPVLEVTFVTMLVNLVLVVGLYVFVGNSGVFSFGHVGFMALGAYTTAILRMPEMTRLALLPDAPAAHLPAVPATLAGGLVAAAVAAVIAVPLMRLSGLTASLGTFAFLNIAYVVAINWRSTTGGSTGMAGIPTMPTPWIAFGWAVVAIAIAWAFQATRSCLRLRATREDEPAAVSLAISVVRERSLAFVLSAFVTGIGGGLFAQAFGTFNPDAFFLAQTFTLVAMLVIGGTLSLSGAVVGCVFVSVTGELLRRMEVGLDRPGMQGVGFALMMVLVLVLRPRGLTHGAEISLDRAAQTVRGIASGLRSRRPT